MCSTLTHKRPVIFDTSYASTTEIIPVPFDSELQHMYACISVTFQSDYCRHVAASKLRDTN